MLRRLLPAGIALALGLSGLAAMPEGTAADPQPNILVIVTDDQRARGTVMRETMPFTWSVFQEGATRYPQAYATTPLCCPARSTLFTGLYAHNHAVHTNEPEEMNLDHSRTVHYYLQQAGYRTAIFGKYLNGWDVADDPPYFDRWATFNRGLGGSDGYYDLTFNVQGQLRTISTYSTDYIAGEADRFIRAQERNDARPWFLYVAPFAPHMPATASPKYAGAPVPDFAPNPAMLETNRSDKPPYIRDTDLLPLWKIRQTRRRQLRSLMSVDDLVERVLRAIWDSGEGRHTLVFFVSDNGLLWGEHGWRRKSVPYTESTRIAMFARWPGHFARGAADRRIASNVDIAPTILDAAGIEPSTPMDGQTLLDPWGRRRILTESWQGGSQIVPDWASIRTKKRQYVEYYSDTGTVTFQEYYDLERDPYQLRNLLRDERSSNDPPSEVIAGLHTQLQADRTCSGTSCP